MKIDDLITVIENQMKANKELHSKIESLEALNHVALSLAFFTTADRATKDPDYKQAMLEFIDTVDAPPGANKQLAAGALEKVRALIATRDNEAEPDTKKAILRLITTPPGGPGALH